MFIKSSRQRGISLVELVIFIVVVGIGLTGLLVVMGTASRSADPLRRKQALMIAESLMEEVMLARFTFCDISDPNVELATAATVAQCPTQLEGFGPEAGNVRPFDNVNDYVPAANTLHAGAFQNVGGVLVDLNNNPFPAGYTASLTVTPTIFQGVAANAALKITVVVSDTVTKTEITLQSFRLQYAPNSPP